MMMMMMMMSEISIDYRSRAALSTVGNRALVKCRGSPHETIPLWDTSSLQTPDRILKTV